MQGSAPAACNGATALLACIDGLQSHEHCPRTSVKIMGCARPADAGNMITIDKQQGKARLRLRHSMRFAVAEQAQCRQRTVACTHCSSCLRSVLSLSGNPQENSTLASRSTARPSGEHPPSGARTGKDARARLRPPGELLGLGRPVGRFPPRLASPGLTWTPQRLHSSARVL